MQAWYICTLTYHVGVGVAVLSQPGRPRPYGYWDLRESLAASRTSLTLGQQKGVRRGADPRGLRLGP
jgi:hypothetical protein